MEISLTHILLAVIGVGFLVIIVQVIIFSKLKSRQDNSVQLLKDTNSQLSQAIDAIPSLIQVHFQTGVEKITDTQKECQNQTLQSIKALNQLFSAKIEDKHVESCKQLNQLQTQLQQLQQQHSTLSSTSHEQTVSQIVSALMSSQKNLETDLSDKATALNSAIKRTQTELEKNAKEQTFTNKQHQLSNLETLSSLIQNLRVQNLVELTNELAQHTELTVDTLDFVKHLGECKVVKIEDKNTGQVTQVYYENGIKHSSDTLQGEQLKYQMFYDQEGRLAKGIEFNSDQQISFEYVYDAAGEINERLEYVYDANGKQSDPIKKIY